MFIKLKYLCFKRSLNNRSIITCLKLRKNSKKDVLKIRDLTNSKMWRYKKRKFIEEYARNHAKFLSRFA